MGFWKKSMGRVGANASDLADSAQPAAAVPSPQPVVSIDLAANTAQAQRLADLDRQTEKDPRSAQAWFAKAEVLAESGRHEEALAAYDRALQWDPRLAMALRGKALVLRQIHKTAEALETVDLALQVDPGLALAWRAKGAILRDLERHAEGLACYETGLTIDPQDALLWSNKGNVLLKLGRIAEARASYQRALTIDPGFADAINGLRRAKNAEVRIDNFRRDPPDGRHIVVTASGTENLKHWLSVLGFELRREPSGSTTLVGDDAYERIVHYKNSLWVGSCRLGEWGTRDNHDVWFTLQPEAGAEHGGPQYDGWNRLAELLAAKAEQDPPPGGLPAPGFAPVKTPDSPETLRKDRVPSVISELKWSQPMPTFDLGRRAHLSKRLTVHSYSSQDAEPEETCGNLLTSGSSREEVPKKELEDMNGGGDATVMLCLEAHGYRLTGHTTDERRGSHEWWILHGDECIGRMVSHDFDLSINLYRSCAEYSRILEVLRS